MWRDGVQRDDMWVEVCGVMVCRIMACEGTV